MEGIHVEISSSQLDTLSLEPQNPPGYHSNVIFVLWPLQTLWIYALDVCLFGVGE